MIGLLQKLIDILENLLEWYQEKQAERLLGVARNSGWSELRNRYFKANPNCEMCGRKGQSVHHIFPVHKFPEREMLWVNLITGCRRCHLDFFHLKFYASWNEDVRADALYWKNKIAQRPYIIAV